MDLPIRRCNALDDTGLKRCGTIGGCTHVRTLDIDWTWLPLYLLGFAGALIFGNSVQVLEDRWVCLMCRRRLRLPDHDLDMALAEVS